MFRRRFRHMNRYREIAVILSKNGFGYILDDIGLFHMLSLPKRVAADFKKPEHSSIGPKLRKTLEELGPTFIKLGQILSTRRDIFPVPIIKELEKLQDDVNPFPFEESKAIIEEQLEAPLDSLFDDFGEEPAASASIGQVHLALLKDGTKVAVKVRRPDIVRQVGVDLSIMKELGRLLEQQFDWARYYRVRDIIDEFSRSIKDELDYTLEAHHTEKVANQFKDNENIVIPSIYWDYSTEAVLVQEFIKGEKLGTVEGLSDEKREALADSLVNCFFEQIFIHGFFHADPHPGNVFYLPEGKLALIDFGQVGRLTKTMRYQFSSLVIAMLKQDPEAIMETFMDMSLVDSDVDENRLRSDIELLNQKYFDMKLSEISIGDAVNDLFMAAQRNNIIIPVEYTILGKAVLTVESLAEELNPDLSILKLAEPYGKRLVKERYNPRRVGEQVWDDLKEWGELLQTLPKQTRDLLSKTNKDKLRINISLPETQQLLFKLDRISNRISFSITLLAFSIIVVGLIIGSTFGNSSSILTEVPAIEIGFVISFLMFLWLIYSILKSGKF